MSVEICIHSIVCIIVTIKYFRIYFIICAFSTLVSVKQLMNHHMSLLWALLSRLNMRLQNHEYCILVLPSYFLYCIQHLCSFLVQSLNFSIICHIWPIHSYLSMTNVIYNLLCFYMHPARTHNDHVENFSLYFLRLLDAYTQ